MDKPVVSVDSPVILIALCVTAACSRSPSGQPPDCASRIVSTSPIVTDLILAMDKTANFVAVDSHSARLVPSAVTVGRFQSLDVGAIAKMRPSEVFMDVSETRAIKQARQLDLPIHVLGVESLGDLDIAIQTVGTAICKQDKAKALQEQLRHTQKRYGLKMRPVSPSVLAVVDRRAGALAGIFVAGRDTYFDELLSLVKAKNAAAAIGSGYKKLTAAEVIKLEPDILIDSQAQSPPDKARNLWSEAGLPESVRLLPIPNRQFATPTVHLENTLATLEAILYPQTL